MNSFGISLKGRSFVHSQPSELVWVLVAAASRQIGSPFDSWVLVFVVTPSCPAMTWQLVQGDPALT